MGRHKSFVAIAKDAIEPESVRGSLDRSDSIFRESRESLPNIGQKLRMERHTNPGKRGNDCPEYTINHTVMITDVHTAGLDARNNRVKK